LQQEQWDLDAILERHDAEHESIGLDVLLRTEDVERLNLILQAPRGGLIDDPPLWISELLPSADEMQVYGGLCLEEIEREIRRHLETELWKEDIGLKEDADDKNEGSDGLGKEMKNLNLNDVDEADTAGGLNMNQIMNAQGSNTHMHKERTYTKIRGTTILLKPNPNNKVRTMAASHSNTHNSNDPDSTNVSNHTHATTGAELALATNGRLHDVHVSDCSDAHIYLLQPFEHATLSGCTDCTIVVGAVAGLLYVVDCERTNITSAARRVLVSNCFDVTHSIFTPSPPLLVGDNRRCQFAPYNTYYDGLREDLLATGLAAAVLSPDNVVIGDSVHGPALQCASNKWKQPSELSKLSELLQVPAMPQRQKSSGSSDEKALSKTGGGEDTMQAPTLVPASEFQVLFVPLESEANKIRRLAEEAREEEMTVHTTGSEENSIASANTYGTHGTHRAGGIGSNYSHNLADVLQLSPFRLPTEFERRALVKADRMKSLQQAIQTDLTPEQQVKLEEELNRGFRDWLVTSGNLRQVLDLVHLESKEAT
jgi:TBCC domain-containing protein 1